VDVFAGANEGLILAELELSSEDESFEKPSWLGQEVTGDMRYHNSMLLKHPYNKWYK
jgi:CYTH domain-containing protein